MKIHELIKLLLKYDLESEVKVVSAFRSYSAEIASVTEKNKTIYISDENSHLTV